MSGIIAHGDRGVEGPRTLLLLKGDLLLRWRCKWLQVTVGESWEIASVLFTCMCFTINNVHSPITSW